jgi:hypothetical protein
MNFSENDLLWRRIPSPSFLSVELICFRSPWVTQHILARRVPNKGHELEEGFPNYRDGSGKALPGDIAGLSGPLGERNLPPGGPR